MKLILTAAFTAAGLGVTACGPAPTAEALRLSGPASATYDADLVQCRQVALRYDTEMTKEGAIGGAVIGGLIGATESGGDALAGAAIGGLLGAADGSIEKEESQRSMIINCMQNRGHPVIG